MFLQLESSQWFGDCQSLVGTAAIPHLVGGDLGAPAVLGGWES